jgi:hypothetical protein
MKFVEHMPLFIGLLVWTRSSTISIDKPKSNLASFGRSLERKQTRVGYDTETEFPVGLVWVKAKTLSRIGSRSWVRSGSCQEAGLRQVPYLGRSGLPG